MKPIWQSKTLWVNAIALVALVVQTQTGMVIDPSAQVAILGFVNVILRTITKDAVTWKASK